MELREGCGRRGEWREDTNARKCISGEGLWQGRCHDSLWTARVFCEQESAKGKELDSISLWNTLLMHLS